ncbi:MAG: hypothetical protein JSR83_12735 [Proteobacteria bacterium]|nr:hypothetical protein [Pseudomonadota bacterium]
MQYHKPARARFDIDTDQRQDISLIWSRAELIRDHIAALNRQEVKQAAEGNEEVIRLLSEALKELEDFLSSISGEAARPNH